jgi:hypothetical protein
VIDFLLWRLGTACAEDERTDEQGEAAHRREV